MGGRPSLLQHRVHEQALRALTGGGGAGSAGAAERIACQRNCAAGFTPPRATRPPSSERRKGELLERNKPSPNKMPLTICIPPGASACGITSAKRTTSERPTKPERTENTESVRHLRTFSGRGITRGLTPGRHRLLRGLRPSPLTCRRSPWEPDHAGATQLLQDGLVEPPLVLLDLLGRLPTRVLPHDLV